MASRSQVSVLDTVVPTDCRKCHRPIHAQGLCEPHYRKALRSGELARVHHRDETLAERLLRNTAPEGDCAAVWTGAKDKDGYGRIRRPGGKGTRAHIVAWELANPGQDRTGKEVCHTCDNPPCCDPVHLFLGTTMDNHDDAVQKGRKRQIMTRELLLRAQELIQSGYSQTAAAQTIGISRPSLSRYLAGSRVVR